MLNMEERKSVPVKIFLHLVNGYGVVLMETTKKGMV